MTGKRRRFDALKAPEELLRFQQRMASAAKRTSAKAPDSRLKSFEATAKALQKIGAPIRDFAERLNPVIGEEQKPEVCQSTVIIGAPASAPQASSFPQIKAEKKRRGRRPTADWDAVRLALMFELNARGMPDEESPPDWQRQADVERWIAELLQQLNEKAAPSTIRGYASRFLTELSAEQPKG